MDKNMKQYLDKAEVLIEALPYIQKFNRKVIVVKYGGSAMVCLLYTSHGAEAKASEQKIAEWAVRSIG